MDRARRSGLRRLARVVVLLALVGLVLTPRGLGSIPPPMRAATFTPRPGSETGGGSPELRVVALGDSVTSGYHCDCTPFPTLYARDLARARHVSTSAVNLGVPGLDSDGLLAMVEKSASTRKRLAGADVVVVTIGANDFSSRHDDVVSGGCRQPCLDPRIDRTAATVREIVRRVRALRSGRPTAVLVTGYWNVFEGGDVARRRYPQAGLDAAADLTVRVNDALRSAARETGAAYVDIRTPFLGASGDGDDTDLLAADGDHPNARGHARIAQALLDRGLPGLGSSR